MARWLSVVAFVLVLVACDNGGQATLPDSSRPAGPARDIHGNLVAGDGWALLAFTRSGLTYGVAVAESEADAVRMWAALPFDVAVPAVDYSTHVLLVLGHAVSGSCPDIEFRGLEIGADHVYGKFAFEPAAGGCTSDANPAAFLLAVERAALPDRFLLTLEEEDVCAGCREDTITVDLTSDVPDDSQWWAQGRFGVVIGGAAPADSHVFVLRYGGVAEPLAILAADWQEAPRWVTGGERFPDRVEAFSANCVGGEECIENLEALEPTGPVCGTNVDVGARQDLAILITFAADASCTIELVPGTDGTEFMVTGDEPSR